MGVRAERGRVMVSRTAVTFSLNDEMEILNSLVELQQRHDLLLLHICGDLQRRPTALASFANVRARLDERDHDTLVPFLSGVVKRGGALRVRLVHIRARLYELHDDVRVALISGEVQRRNVEDWIAAHSIW